MSAPGLVLTALVATAVAIVAAPVKGTIGFVALCALLALPIALTAVLIGRAWHGREVVAPDSRPGGWAERVLAWLIDVVLPFVAAAGIDVFARYAAEVVATDPESLVFETLTMPAVIVLWIANFVLLQALTGRTIGKQVMGLRTVRRNGGRPPIWGTLVRTVSVFPLLGPLPALVELGFVVKRGDRIGDRVARTRVLRS